MLCVYICGRGSDQTKASQLLHIVFLNSTIRWCVLGACQVTSSSVYQLVVQSEQTDRQDPSAETLAFCVIYFAASEEWSLQLLIRMVNWLAGDF